MTTLPAIVKKNRPKLQPLITNETKTDSSTIYEYQISGREHISEREHDAHTQTAGILSPARSPSKRATRGSVTDFASFLKSFNKQQETTKAMLSDYKGTKEVEKNIKQNNSVPKLDLKYSTTAAAPSPAANRFKNMRHTISAASALQQHLNATIKPRKYQEEAYLSVAAARDRKRLATRLNMLGFPLDPCYQALKQSSNKASDAASLLLKWYPKGQGGRNLVQRMVNVIETSELKLIEAHDKIKSVMSDGTPADRLTTVSRFFIECDIGEKGYLTPLEFSNLSSNLGVELTTAELREAVMLIDDDGNGRVELVEYLEWWGDDEVLNELINTSGKTTAKINKGKKITRHDTKMKNRISRTSNLNALKTQITIEQQHDHELGRLSPSSERNVKFAKRKSLGKQLTASDYLQQSMTMLQRHKQRSKASANINSQIGMYSHIRDGGWFDTDGNMHIDENRKKSSSSTSITASPNTDLNRQRKATRFVSEMGGEIAKMKDELL